jgi:hypothetical protein
MKSASYFRMDQQKCGVVCVLCIMWHAGCVSVWCGVNGVCVCAKYVHCVVCRLYVGGVSVCCMVWKVCVYFTLASSFTTFFYTDRLHRGREEEEGEGERKTGKAHMKKP